MREQLLRRDWLALPAALAALLSAQVPTSLHLLALPTARCASGHDSLAGRCSAQVGVHLTCLAAVAARLGRAACRTRSPVPPRVCCFCFRWFRWFCRQHAAHQARLAAAAAVQHLGRAGHDTPITSNLHAAQDPQLNDSEAGIPGRAARNALTLAAAWELLPHRPQVNIWTFKRAFTRTMCSACCAWTRGCLGSAAAPAPGTCCTL